MSRGNQGNVIFRADRDRIFLDTLGEGCAKTGWIVHAYVLMANHYHLLVETPEGNLVAGLKWLQGTYTQRYEVLHEVFGHLFQGRHKALRVDGSGDEYPQVVSRRLQMGHESRVTQAVAAVRGTRDREVLAWRGRLQRLNS